MSKVTNQSVVNVSSLLLYLRAVMLSLVLMIISYYDYAHDSVSESLFFGLAVLFGLTAISGFYLSNMKPGKYYVAIELFIHSAIVTLIIYNTGLVLSPWLALYLPLVILATMVLNYLYGLFVTLASIICYGLAIQNEMYQWLPVPLLVEPSIEFSQGIAIQLLSLLSSMTLIAIGVGFLKKQIAFKEARLQSQERRFSELIMEDAAIMTSIDQGIVIIDLAKRSLRINNKAQSLLNIPDEENIVFEDLQRLVPQAFDPIADLSNSFFMDFGGRHLKFQVRLDGGTLFRIVSIYDNTELEKMRARLDQQNEMARLRSSGLVRPTKFEFENYFVARSQVMQDIFETIKKVAESRASVLIIGESGTGKEVVAKAIHQCSARSDQAFIAVNCGAIPENLIESQLFGHTKGSFTGAVSDNIGLFKQADGGTLFLDEIGELPVHLQAKLLRVIQTQKVRPVGSEEEMAIDVRILSATNQNLDELIVAKTFREDLYYRLNVVKIKLPPLRERKEDLIPLINFILNKLAPNTSPIVSPNSINILREYDYPGNIRELENILERALVLGGEAILVENLPEAVRVAAADSDQDGSSIETDEVCDSEIAPRKRLLDEDFNLDQYLKNIERSYLEAALEETDGVKTRAAKVLGLNFRSFRYRLDKFDIEG